ncbi:uncharacterized protein MONBRDRAFT_29713 [Monosiga brevicollis MX1]|uniref:Prefoldin subunit 3 n=1 Tax=Monosiga brevicollis TaxID=81824 RepID=A9VBX0_MONBE|nr:uncharacterized protein MONBRDRAFT_29713 [Monosiga brevicollis MX1]EDQ85049.1 predicted protein [Monosiga brevicollis MX1]|eukprot:XP_001750219.1 hypothetical protein [Monosiga brevicollis MX1]
MAAKDIPEATFIEDIDAFMVTQNGASPDAIMQDFATLNQKYSMIESQIAGRRAAHMKRLPEMKKTFEAVKMLQKQRWFRRDGVCNVELTLGAIAQDEEAKRETIFPLAEGVLARATVPPSGTVMLWLGAQVMLEYEIDEAHDLLKAQVEGLESSIATAADTLDFLKNQITTVQVNLARLYNWQVIKNREKKASAATASDDA